MLYLVGAIIIGGYSWCAYACSVGSYGRTSGLPMLYSFITFAPTALGSVAALIVIQNHWKISSDGLLTLIVGGWGATALLLLFFIIVWPGVCFIGKK